MPYNLVFIATDFLNNESGGIKSILKLIGLIILCVLIIVASYFTTRFVGKKQLATKGKSNFRSIDTMRIAPNKFLQIVEIGERYFCIAVSKESITTVCELDKEDIKHFPQMAQEVKSFKECMSDIINRKKKKENEIPRFDLTSGTESDTEGGDEEGQNEEIQDEEREHE